MVLMDSLYLLAEIL